MPKLGVGLEYQSALRQFILDRPEVFDFLEVIPDLFWTDLGQGSRPRFVNDLEAVAFVDEVRLAKRIVCHSIGLSIGSANRFDRDHTAQIRRWYEWLAFPWHSDHLSFQRAEHEDGEVNLGVTMPLPLDTDTLDLLVPRLIEVRERIPVPYLLENNVYYFRMAEAEFEEPEFLNLLCDRSGCGLLLDLHNLYVNQRNHGIDALAFLDRLDLSRVFEVHVAGGLEQDDFYLDAHSGPLPEEVWDLLESTLPRCPNVGGLVFEMVGSWLAPMGQDRLADELIRLREAWLRHQPLPAAAM